LRNAANASAAAGFAAARTSAGLSVWGIDEPPVVAVSQSDV
jgi:hypothetical protein